MKVSRSKTEYLCINGGNDDETVKMKDAKVPRVKEFKYLGSAVQESGGCEREVKKRVLLISKFTVDRTTNPSLLSLQIIQTIGKLSEPSPITPLAFPHALWLYNIY